jgi:hypothetical protein
MMEPAVVEREEAVEAGILADVVKLIVRELVDGGLKVAVRCGVNCGGVVSLLICGGARCVVVIRLTLKQSTCRGRLGCKTAAIDLEGMREINTGRDERCALLHGCAALG